MIDIIPNWHPTLVHFTIGLLFTSSLLYALGYLLKRDTFFLVARWNLWIGVIITMATVLMGFYAYSTVAHDEVSHAAMTNHRNWALFTAAAFLILALWAVWRQRGAKTVSLCFVIIILMASLLLVITGYKGAEVVYRHGTGVMRLPVIQGDGSHDSHLHEGGEVHKTMPNHDDMSNDSIETESKPHHDDDNHSH